MNWFPSIDFFVLIVEKEMRLPQWGITSIDQQNLHGEIFRFCEYVFMCTWYSHVIDRLILNKNVDYILATTANKHPLKLNESETSETQRNCIIF